MLDQMGEEPYDLKADIADLSDQQQTIIRFKRRGISQKAIAKFLQVTPARVSQEVKAIREHYQERGSSLDQAEYVGSTYTLYEEVEKKVWEIFHSAAAQDNTHAGEALKLKALSSIRETRGDQSKLGMELGQIKRAAIEHKTTTTVSPVMESLTPERRVAVVATIIQPKAGKAPTPPEPEEVIAYESARQDDTEDED